MERLNRSHFTVIAAIFLAGCVSFEPIKLAENAKVAKGDYALLWSTGYYVKLFEMMNYADIKVVDGVTLKEGAAHGVPIEISPGSHIVEISFRKDSFLCGWPGCITIYQASRQLQFHAVAGHSYIPFTRKYCDRNWFWITDTGNETAVDIATWNRTGSYGFSYVVRTAEKWKQTVVAGEEPPETCEGP
jgi:hypothetical protein